MYYKRICDVGLRIFDDFTEYHVFKRIIYIG